MKCFSCQQEFGIMPYVVMPLLDKNSCMNCWTTGEDFYYSIVNSKVKEDNAKLGI
jgi:hypothetical protein